jgi:ankyrin repeat protein
MSSGLSLHDVVVSASYLPELRRRIACGAGLNRRDSRGSQPIHVATRLNLIRTVRCLVEAGAALDGRDELDLTPLMIACHNGRVKGSAIALLLLEAGANVNEVRAADGITALHWAAENAQPAVVEALLAAGAPVDGPPDADMTPLMFAAMGGNVAALEVLVRHGADVNRKRTGRPAAMRGLTAKGHAMEFRQRKAWAYLDWLEVRGYSGTGPPRRHSEALRQRSRPGG